MARPATILLTASIAIAAAACAPPAPPRAAPANLRAPPAAEAKRAPAAADLARAEALRDEAELLFIDGDCTRGDGARTLDLLARSRAIAPSIRTTKRTLNCLLQLVRKDRGAVRMAASEAERAEADAQLARRYDDTIAALDELRVAFSTELRPGDARDIASALSFLARDGVVVLDVSTDVEGVVAIDGLERGPVSSRRTYWARAGRHTLRVARAGFVPFERIVEPADGSLVEVVVHLEEVPAPKAPERAPVPAPPPRERVRLGGWAAYLRGSSLGGDAAPTPSGCQVLPRRAPSLAGLSLGMRAEVPIARGVTLEAGASYLRAETWEERRDACTARLETVHVLLHGALVAAGASFRAPVLGSLSLLARTSAGLWFTEATIERSGAALLAGGTSPAPVVEPELGAEIDARDLRIGATFGLVFVPSPFPARGAGAPRPHGSFVMLSPQITISYAPR